MPRFVPLHELQPSQLYVSSVKLAALLEAWTSLDPGELDPVPVKQYGDRLVTTDGHTRALAAYRAGLDSILVVPDDDELDDEAYEACVGWCIEAGVLSVADLDDRVVDPGPYQRLWLDRCRKLFRDLGREDQA